MKIYAVEDIKLIIVEGVLYQLVECLPIGELLEGVRVKSDVEVPISLLGKRPEKKERRCGNCKELGHRADSCPGVESKSGPVTPTEYEEVRERTDKQRGGEEMASAVCKELGVKVVSYRSWLKDQRKAESVLPRKDTKSYGDHLDDSIKKKIGDYKCGECGNEYKSTLPIDQGKCPKCGSKDIGHFEPPKVVTVD